MFYLNIFYKHQIYDDIFMMHLENKINNDNDNINKHIQQCLNKYSKMYIEHYAQFKINNNIIFKTIKEMNLIITDKTYNESYLNVINKYILNKDIIFNSYRSCFVYKLYGFLIKQILYTITLLHIYSFGFLSNYPISCVKISNGRCDCV
jgi:hypothetical protein